LVWKDDEAYKVKETKVWGPNVLTFQLVTGRHQYYVVGCYIPPSDLATLDDIQKAWNHCPSGARPLLLGDLNINLESPRDERDEKIAEQCDYMDLTDITSHFRQRRWRRTRGKWTWRQRREGRWISTRPDYILAREEDRGRFKRVGIRVPRHHKLDH